MPTAAYVSMSGDGLRQAHAHQSAERADAAATFTHTGGQLHLWTRRGPGGAPWVALVTSVSAPDRIALSAGYRVPAADAEEAGILAEDPARALARLLGLYGLTYFSGSQRVRLLEEHIVRVPGAFDRLSPSEFQRAVALEEPPEGARLAVNVAVSTTSDGATRLAWFFVIDLAAYGREVAARRR